MELFESVLDKGKALAESAQWKPYFVGKDGGFSLDEKKRALTAYLLEIEKQYIGQLDEDTRVASIGSFEKYVFPIIRAVFPNLVATELVSVQPMQGPTSLVFYMDFRAGSRKGSVGLGDTLIGARRGQEASTDYSGERIDAEVVATATATAAYAGLNLSYFPIRPLSVELIAVVGGVEKRATDDGNGGLSGAGFSAGALDYSSGALSFTTSANTDAGVPITVTYLYASEGSLQVPQVDVSITSIPVTARPRKLRARWSVEAANQMRAVHGTDVETEVTTAMAEEIRFDIDREIIKDLLGVAARPDNASKDFTFYTVPPPSVSFFEHKMTIVDTFIAHSNAIFQATRRATGNWIVMGVGVANIVESLPIFKPTTVTGSGVVYMGDLQGKWRIYKDPYMDSDTFIMGHRGESFMDTGYIYAPWIPLYTTPTVYLDDFIGRKGLLTQYAKKITNGLFYSQGVIKHVQHP